MNRQILKNIVLGCLFALPFLPFLVSSALFFPFITTKAYAFRILVEVAFAAWALLALLDPAYRPRKSWTTYALLAFIAIIGIADLFGVAPAKSFWSNSERMEGWITLLHLGMLYIVMRGTLTLETWKRWWQTTLGASFLMSLYCVFQLLGVLEIHQGGARVDGTLGNAAYLAVYMLFHVFMALYFFARSKSSLRWVYGALAILNAAMVYYSGTRGAILGLLGGLFIAALLSIRNREAPLARKLSIAYVGVFVVIILGFFALRNTSFVQSSPVLSRFASISPAELKTEGRSFIWPMALKGIKERPILGWGQDNFNYIFNKYYSPEMYHLEPWFDRAHNIFLDWATQGGILGLIAYLALYYVLLRNVWKSARFSYADKALITGLTAAYFFHNIFVFDNLISYILFISLLAFVDAHQDAPVVMGEKHFSEDSVRTIGGPAALIALLVVLYFFNVQPIRANMSLLNALQAVQTGDATSAIAGFENAYNRARLGRPEVVEQMASNAPGIFSSAKLTADEKNAFYAFVRTAVEKQASDFPEDARYQLLAGTFLDNTGQYDDALKYLEKAKSLTPGKQAVSYEIAGVYINKGDNAKGLEILKEAYNLDRANIEAETAYLVGAIYAKDRATETMLVADLVSKSPASLLDSRVINAYLDAGRYADVAAIMQKKLAENPNDPQAYVNLAAVELKAGDKNAAIATLTKLGSALPAYKATADSYIEQIKNGTLK